MTTTSVRPARRTEPMPTWGALLRTLAGAVTFALMSTIARAAIVEEVLAANPPK